VYIREEHLNHGDEPFVDVHYFTRVSQKVPRIDIERLVHHEFVLPGQSATGHFCVRVLQRLSDAIRRKRLDKWQTGTVVSASLYRTEPHIACCAAVPAITQPPQSPDLAPSDF
jgi:hypothetical protein